MRLIVYLGWILLFTVSAIATEQKAPPGNHQLPACPPDWKVEVVASAPAVINPSAICCSPDGKIFVGEDPMDMGEASDKPTDRIICIHPDGHITVFATNLYAVYGLQYIDGKVYVHHSPKFSVFDDANGFGSNRVDLIQSDNLHPWSPTFNDHIPSNCRLAMDGYLYISTGDKGIYGAVGPDGKKLELHGGGVYRMRPNGTELEVYSTGTRNHLDVAINAEDEIFTYDNTDDGQGWWTRVTHMVDGGFYGYPYDYKPQRPYTLWMMEDYGGGSPTGAIAYNEDALPEEYRGNLFLCEWARAQLLRLKVERTGATYKVASRMKNGELDFLSKKPDHVYPSFFSPVGITVTPDGTGFYVTDWFWAGWKNNSGDNSIKEGVGRVLKVTYTGAMKPAAKPSWFVDAGTGKKFKSSTKDLIKGLSHPAQSVRLVAQRRLADRKFDGYSRIISLLKDKKALPYARWSALWTLDAIDGGKKARSTIVSVLKDKDDSVRMQAARQLGTRKVKDKEVITSLTAMLSDTNAAIVFRAATALGRIGDSSATKALIAALEQKDLFARYAVFTALNRIGNSDAKAWRAIVDALSNNKPAVREGAGFALRETYNDDLAKTLIETARSPSESIPVRTNVLSLLSQIYRKPPAWNGEWWNTGPAGSPPPSHTVDWPGTPAIAEAMRGAMKDTDLSIRRVALEWVKESQDATSAPVLRAMFNKETDEPIKISIIKILGDLKDADSANLIRDILVDQNTKPTILNEAIEAAGKINTPEIKSILIQVAERNLASTTLAKLLQSFGASHLTNATPVLGKNLTNTNATVRQNAETALVQIGGEQATKEFLSMLLNSSDIERRRAAARSLGNLKASSAVSALIDASTNPSTREDATAALTQMPEVSALDAFLVSLDSKNASLRGQCQQAIETIRDAALPFIEKKISTNGIPTDLVGPLQKIYAVHEAALKGPLFKIRATSLTAKDYEAFALKNSGEGIRGKKIFNDLSGVACTRCHQINGQGGQVGPDLSDIGKRSGRGAIIDSILNPSKQILDGYQVVNFELKDGAELSGAVRSENSEEVTVMDSAGEKHQLKKKEIAKRANSKVSLMPEELHTGLGLLEFADLIAYVAGSQTNQTNGASANNPAVPPAKTPGITNRVIKLTPAKLTAETTTNAPASSAPKKRLAPPPPPLPPAPRANKANSNILTVPFPAPPQATNEGFPPIEK